MLHVLHGPLPGPEHRRLENDRVRTNIIFAPPLCSRENVVTA